MAIKWNKETPEKLGAEEKKIKWVKNEKSEALLKSLQEKEILEKLPELDNENFRIKNIENRIPKKDPNWVKVLEHPEGGVRQYLEGEFKGQQLFTRYAAIRETVKAGKKIVRSWTVYRDILIQKYKWNFKKFIKWEKIVLCGRRNPESETFTSIGTAFNFRCEDGTNYYGIDYRNGRWNNNWDDLFAFPVRCEK